MGRLLKKLFKLGTFITVVVVIVRGLKQFEGAPEHVGDEGFSFAPDADGDPYAIDEGTLGGEVSSELLERLVDPEDKGALELVDGKWLVNPRNGNRYPISDGIPVMLAEVGERYRDPSAISGAASATTEGS